MGSFIYIPIIALFCYTTIMLAFVAAKKTKLIYSFLMLLGSMIFWTGGSMMMRFMLWPGVKFWYDVSLLGIIMFPSLFLMFVYEYVESKEVFYKRFWFFAALLCNIFNMATGLLLASPEPVMTASGGVSFVYHATGYVAVFFIVCGLTIVNIIRLLIENSQKTELTQKQFTPIVLGAIIMFLGNLLITLPVFKGIPFDIAAGAINAFLLIYVLYKLRLFKLTLLVSRGNCYGLAACATFIVFFNFLRPLQRFIKLKMPSLAEYDVLIVSIFFSVSTIIIYNILKLFIDRLFTRDEIVQAENLKEFSSAVSKSLQVDEILEELIQVIQKTIPVKRVYILISNNQGKYTVAHSTSPLDPKTIGLSKDNPVVKWMENHNECILMKDFRRTTAYKSMWEKEKEQFTDLCIECLVPLKNDSELVGIILLSAKEKHASFTNDDLNFLSSVDSIGSIAVKNSKLYEKAYYEARTDELTGLYNRKYFYEILQREYERCKEGSLALIILNIDDFKLYNQLYGNREGDIALQKAAQIITASVGGNGFVARYSGKEFAIILPFYDVLSAKTLGETIRKQILNMNKRATDYALKVLTVSGGICAIPYSASTVKQLIDNADMSVYQVKRSGKNSIMVYSAGDGLPKSPEKQNHKGMESIYSEYAATIYALTAAIDTKDHYTFSHSKNVAYYSTELAYAYGMNKEFIELVREAALLHDIGKIGIPENILNKPGRLTESEYETMKGHVENSIGIIRHLPSLDYVIPAVIGHHERYDGSGYPRRISGEDIPVSARILCIADAFDAMTSRRAYKEPYVVEEALQIIDHEAGRQFDPKLARLFISLVRKGAIRVEKEKDDETA